MKIIKKEEGEEEEEEFFWFYYLIYKIVNKSFKIKYKEFLMVLMESF